MRVQRLAIAAIVILAAPVAAGCGGDDEGERGQATTPEPTATESTTAGGLRPSPDDPHDRVRLSRERVAIAAAGAELGHEPSDGEDPKDTSVKAGKVTITAPNDGKVVHELVLLKTDEDPAALPKKDDEVDESTSVGEIADVEPGSTKKATFKLAPGKYAMVCAATGPLPGRDVWVADGRVTGQI